MPRGTAKLSYGRCADCGFVQVSLGCAPTKEQSRQRYLAHENGETNAGYVEFLDGFIRKAVMPSVCPPARLLDFGSGPNPLLADRLARLGYDCTPYDPLFHASRGWRSRSFDAILLHEVAEHLRWPGPVLGCLRARLRDGGKIILRTRFLPADEEFAAWWYRMDPTHIGFFSVRSLEKAALSIGMRLTETFPPDIAILSM